jgi:hypothetical protein
VVQMVTLSMARHDRPKLDSEDTATSIQHQPNLDDPAQYSALPDFGPRDRQGTLVM